MAKAKHKPVSGPSLFEASLPSAGGFQETDIVSTPVADSPPSKGGSGVGGLEALLRDGSILRIGDECTIDDGILTGLLKEAHEGKTYIIEKMTAWANCESGMLVIARQKDNPELRTTGIGGKGIDANWFKKV